MSDEGRSDGFALRIRHSAIRNEESEDCFGRPEHAPSARTAHEAGRLRNDGFLMPPSSASPREADAIHSAARRR